MATVFAPPAPLPAGQIVPQPKRWTCAEFHQLGDMGWFEGRRAMLIDGEILEMPGPNPPHAVCTGLAENELKLVFAAGYWVRGQMPLVPGLTTDPEPDLAVVTGSPRDYLKAHPTTALLALEISDTTLVFYTTDKASIYAAGNISDYWVVDLNNRQLIVFRDPRPDESEPYGARYATRVIYGPQEAVAPLAAPQAKIAVAALLP